MTWFYAGSLLVGLLGLFALVVADSLTEQSDGRTGLVWRRSIAAVTALGIAGMSATFGGWPSGLAALGAAVAAAGAAMYAGLVGLD